VWHIHGCSVGLKRLGQRDVEAAQEYVTTDDHGVMRVAESGVILDSVIASFQEGCSAETIVQPAVGMAATRRFSAVLSVTNASVRPLPRRHRCPWQEVFFA
jgi:hypothetical protein